MLRVEVAGLPAIDVAETAFVIGSSTSARIRLPASEARPEHVWIEATAWRTADTRGDIGDGVTFEIGGIRVRVAGAPADAIATPPQRTESLARELVRGLLGTGSQPTLEVERGPVAGAKRTLAPPESVLVIGRGDDAGWVILDGDLSKTHAEIHRGWDGVRIVDLDSKNGTRVDGVAIRDHPLADGARIELGNVVMRYRDPAERHLSANAAPKTSTPSPSRSGRQRDDRPVFYVAVAIALLATGGILWILASS